MLTESRVDVKIHEISFLDGRGIQETKFRPTSVSPDMGAVASRHSVQPKINGPLQYVTSRSEEENARLVEDAMGWCRKGKFQRFRSYRPRQMADLSCTYILKSVRTDENVLNGWLSLKPKYGRCV